MRLESSKGKGEAVTSYSGKGEGRVMVRGPQGYSERWK